MKFRKGTYDDVNSIYQSLSDEDKEYVTPGHREYKNLPESVEARSVAYDGDTPVGFTEIYGPYVKGPRFPWRKTVDRPGYYFVETAVRDGYRGHGLSSETAKRAIKKVIDKIKQNRIEWISSGYGPHPKWEPDRIKWEFVNGNDKSEKAAIRAGFVRKGRNRYEFAIPKEAGMAKCAKANKTQQDYLDYLQYKESPSRSEKFVSYPLDWTPLSDLKSQGYMDGLVERPPKPKEFLFSPAEMPDPKEIEEIEDESLRSHFAGLFKYVPYTHNWFDPDRRSVTVAQDPRGRVSRSMLAHEVGHAKQNIRKDFPLYKGLDPKLSIYNDIESITNGVNKTDTIRCEEDAWDNAPGSYDPKIRELALATYYGDAADKWRTRALEEFEDAKSPRHLPAANRTRTKSVDDSLSPWHLFAANNADIVDPEVAEFWRTNNVPQAYNYLKTLPPGPMPKGSTIIVR